MDVLKDMLNLQKCKIHFTTPEGEYEGIVKLVCPVANKVTIENLVFLPKRLYMGVLHFRVHEILSYKLIDQPQVSLVKETPTVLPLYDSYMKPQDKCILGYDDGDSVCNSEISDIPEEDYSLTLPPKLYPLLPKDSVIIDCIDDEFYQAVEHIKKQDVIGVSFEGPNIGRDGILSWLLISTSCCTFLFDIQVLKERAFENGLRVIMESPTIEKVIHDCRRPSDCLYHTFNVNVVNVFDTQVADIFIKLQYSKVKCRPWPNSLNSCLRFYLEVPSQFLYDKVRRSYHNDIIYYSLRPLKHETHSVLIQNVVYLRLLKSKLNSLLLSPFHRAVEIYLKVVQKATDQELLLEPSVAEGIPPQFELEGIQTVCFKNCISMPKIASAGPSHQEIQNPVKSFINYCNEIKRVNATNSHLEHIQTGGFCQNHNVPKCETNRENPINSSLEHHTDKTSQNNYLSHQNQKHENSRDNGLDSHRGHDLTTQSNNGLCQKQEHNVTKTENSVSNEDLSNKIRSVNKSKNFNMIESAARSLRRDVTEDKKCDNVSLRINSHHQLYKTRNRFPSNAYQLSNDSDDDNPWEKLRAAFTNIDNTEGESNEKIKFIPAGME